MTKESYFKLYPRAVCFFCIALLCAIVGLSNVLMQCHQQPPSMVLLSAVCAFHMVTATLSVAQCLALAILSFAVLVGDEKSTGSLYFNALIPTAFATSLFALVSGAFFGRSAFGEYWLWDFHLTWLLVQCGSLFLGLALRVDAGFGPTRTNNVRSALFILLGFIVLALSYMYFNFFEQIYGQFMNFVLGNTWLGIWVQIGIFFMAGLFYCLCTICSRARTIILECNTDSVWARDGALFGEL